MADHSDHTYISRNGLALHCRDYAGVADRLPILCLHGVTRNGRDFETFANRIAPARRVLAPDQRGRGRSQHDRFWINYVLTTYVDDMWKLLATLKIARVVIVGTSMGGLMAMLMASMRPQAIAGVVLNDIGPEIEVSGAKRIQEYVGRLPAVADWPQAIAQLKSIFGDAHPALDEDQWRRFAEVSYEAQPLGGYRLACDPRVGDALRAVPPGSAPGMWFAFAALKRIPTLVIRGALSDVLSDRTVQRMRQEKPDLDVCVVPNCGHSPFLNEPECIESIDRLLARLD